MNLLQRGQVTLVSFAAVICRHAMLQKCCVTTQIMAVKDTSNTQDKAVFNRFNQRQSGVKVFDVLLPFELSCARNNQSETLHRSMQSSVISKEFFRTSLEWVNNFCQLISF